MEIEWPELDDAIQKRKEQTDRMMREFHAKQFEQEMEQRMEIMFQTQEIRASLEPNKDKMGQLSLQWNEILLCLLERVAKALSYRPVGIRSLIIEAPENTSHSLYWELSFAQMYYRGWISVELQLDTEYEPVQFCVETSKLEFIYSEVTLEGIKAALVKAYHAGPKVDRNREDREGLRVEAFLREWEA
jgi:hypothetical protein